MLKFLSSANCVPCNKTQPNVIHPIKRRSDASSSGNVCRECQNVFPTQEQLELHSIRGTCRTSIQYENMSPYLPQSKPSFSEDNAASESRKDVGSTLLDRFSFIKAFIARTPNSPSKSQLYDKSPKSATSKAMIGDLVTFGNNSPEPSPERSPNKASTNALMRMHTKFSSVRQIVPSAQDLSIADVGIDAIIETIKETKTLSARVKLEAKFIKQYMNKRAIKKYLVDNYWMDNYSRYLNGDKKELPGPIDNRELKKQVLQKIYPEPLFAVNETIWHFFKNLYGGGPDISHSTSSQKRIILEPMSAKLPKIEKTGSNKSMKSTHYVDESSLEMSRVRKKTSSYRLSLHDMNFNLRPIIMLNERTHDGLIACVQMLLSITDLLRVMENERYREMMKSKVPIYWPAFQEVIDAHLKGLSQFAVGSLKRIVNAKLSMADNFDAFEVLNLILSGMESEVQIENSADDKDNTIGADRSVDHAFVNGSQLLTINDLFGGVVQDIFKCLSCGKKSRKERNFLILSLPIIPNQTRTIDDCLAAFEKESEVQDAYFCEYCQTDVKASKRSILYRFPKNLLVHFNRFPNKAEKKIDNFVHYLSENWRIKGKGEPENSTYALTSAISHKGQLESGHFVSYTKRGDSWFMCDDEEIKKISSKAPVVNDAYILSYLRKS